MNWLSESETITLGFCDDGDYKNALCFVRAAINIYLTFCASLPLPTSS